MASSSRGQIGALCAESFCERILSCANDVCSEDNRDRPGVRRNQHAGGATHEQGIHGIYAPELCLCQCSTAQHDPCSTLGSDAFTMCQQKHTTLSPWVTNTQSMRD